MVAGVVAGAQARPRYGDGAAAPVAGAGAVAAVDGALGAARLVPAVAPIAGTP